MRNKWTWLALVAVLALLVAACGDDAEETTTTAAITTTTAAESTTTTAAETTTTTADVDHDHGRRAAGDRHDPGRGQERPRVEPGALRGRALPAGAARRRADRVRELGNRRRDDGGPGGHPDGRCGGGPDLRHLRRHEGRHRAGRRAAPRRPDGLVLGRQRLGRRGGGLPARPDQPGQHHGAHGVRQDDRRLRRRPDHRDRPARLPRPADQRRDPAPGQLGVPGRQVLLGGVPGRRSRRPELPGRLDRLLVLHPGALHRPHPGGQRLLRLGHRRGDLGHRHHRGPGRGRAARRRRRGRVGHPLRLPGGLRRGSRHLPRRPVLQLGPGLQAHRRVGDERDVRADVRVVRAGLGRHQQPRHIWHRFRQGPRPVGGERRARSTSSSPDWPTARSTCSPGR